MHGVYCVNKMETTTRRSSPAAVRRSDKRAVEKTAVVLRRRPRSVDDLLQRGQWDARGGVGCDKRHKAMWIIKCDHATMTRATQQTPRHCRGSLEFAFMSLSLSAAAGHPSWPGQMNKFENRGQAPAPSHDFRAGFVSVCSAELVDSDAGTFLSAWRVVGGWRRHRDIYKLFGHCATVGLNSIDQQIYVCQFPVHIKHDFERRQQVTCG